MQVVSPKEVKGVNVGGYLRTESGVGSAARGYIRALRHLQIPVALQDLSSLTGNRSEDKTFTSFDADFPYDVNIICADVELHFAVLAQVGQSFFKDRYNIGVWAWELPRFPERWYDRFAYYDEIWVASSFIANPLSQVSPVPVVLVPPVLTPEKKGRRGRGRERLGVQAEEFVFLFIFDFHSRAERKNPLAVIEAFKLAFDRAEPVRLVIKCVNARADSANWARMQESSQGYPVSLYDGYWSADEIRDLMAACDAYVSLHRAEGTGLTVTDAMAYGKPVIATGWSGNMNFMNVSNSYPVRYELVEIKQSAGQYRAGETWAEPSVEHAAELMRRLYENPDEALSRGLAAQKEIEALYSEEGVARTIQGRLEIIARRNRFAALKQRLMAPIIDADSFLREFEDVGRFVPGGHLKYQQMLRRIRSIASSRLPSESTVIVVSRGDDQLLQLGDRVGWHFPQTADGVYAGHYPADGREAVEQLERLRARGAEYVLFPQTALWWLDHYEELREHLNRNYLRIWDDENCLIFQL